MCFTSVGEKYLRLFAKGNVLLRKGLALHCTSIWLLVWAVCCWNTQAVYDDSKSWVCMYSDALPSAPNIWAFDASSFDDVPLLLFKTIGQISSLKTTSHCYSNFTGVASRNIKMTPVHIKQPLSWRTCGDCRRKEDDLRGGLQTRQARHRMEAGADTPLAPAVAGVVHKVNSWYPQ